MAKILIIDDENEILEMLRDYLGERDHCITTAPNGEEGIKSLESDLPDIVICDIKMPRVDGFEFLRTLRSQKKWVPVIIISGLGDSSNIFKSYQLEADYYLPKPIDLPGLLKAIDIMSSLTPLRRQ